MLHWLSGLTFVVYTGTQQLSAQDRVRIYCKYWQAAIAGHKAQAAIYEWSPMVLLELWAAIQMVSCFKPGHSCLTTYCWEGPTIDRRQQYGLQHTLSCYLVHPTAHVVYTTGG